MSNATGGPSLEDVLRSTDLPLWSLQVSDYTAWLVYSRLVSYGVPQAEAQAVVDALARRPVPEVVTCLACEERDRDAYDYREDYSVRHA